MGKEDLERVITFACGTDRFSRTNAAVMEVQTVACSEMVTVSTRAAREMTCSM